MATSTIAILITLIVIILFATELIPLPVTAISACLAMGIFGVIPFSDAFSGFGNDVVILVAGAIVIGEALFATGAAQIIGQKLINVLGTNEKTFLAVCIAFTAVLSAFLSNTATVAMMMPIIASASVKSGGKITKKYIHGCRICFNCWRRMYISRLDPAINCPGGPAECRS